MAITHLRTLDHYRKAKKQIDQTATINKNETFIQILNKALYVLVHIYALRKL